MPSDKKEKGSKDEKVVFDLDGEKEMDGTIPGGDDMDSASKVKFANGGTAAEAVVDVEGKTHVHKNAFVGLSKDELMAFESDPYWVKVRWVMLVLFWVIWVAMLVAAIVIIVVAPKCPPRPDLQWWQSSVVYNAYPRSFKDSNGDGVGDLAGIKEQVAHLKDELGAASIYINPIYPSGGQDTGYDITNHTEIDPIFGTIDEFENLMKSLHKKEMHVILDYVPNHTSDQHPWFVKSLEREEPYTDYYVWHDGEDTGSGRPDPPNNWVSVFGGSAWTWNEGRKQYYLHQFNAGQPDLNVRNEAVQQELKDIMIFWLQAGVDGFRVDAVAHLFESEGFEDEPVSDTPGVDYDYLDHIHTTFQPETYQIITEWRELLDNMKKDDGRERVLMVEAYPRTANQTQSLYMYKDMPGAHMPTNMALLDLEAGCDAGCIQTLVDDYMEMTEGTDYWRNWQTGNHDKSRVATRLGSEDLVGVVNMLLMTLPGTPISYYGEEIGMHDVTIDPSEKQDKAGDRDPQRTPMQWTGDAFAGFTTGNSTWLPVADDYKERNVKGQKAHGAGVTPLEVYNHVSKVHKEPSILWGDFHSGAYEGIYFYVRQAKGFEGYLVALNFGTKGVTVNFLAVAPEQNIIPDLGMIVATTGNIKDANRQVELAVGNEVTLDNIRIMPNEGFIFKWDPEAVGQQM